MNEYIDITSILENIYYKVYWMNIYYKYWSSTITNLCSPFCTLIFHFYQATKWGCAYHKHVKHVPQYSWMSITNILENNIYYKIYWINIY